VNLHKFANNAARIDESPERKVTEELERRVKRNLDVLLRLLKMQSVYPPASAAAALARATGQIVTLAAIYDEAIELYGGGKVELRSWCGRFVDTMAEGLARGGKIAFSGGAQEMWLPLERAQAIGLTLGELLADSSDRSRLSHREVSIEVELAAIEGSRLALRIRDEAPSDNLPIVAELLAKEFGAELWDLSAAGSSERELIFSDASTRS
jgi:Signal transduction histidine kinase